MTRFAPALLVCLASPALGFEACDDLWFSRNQVFDRAGYCFSSPLGQAVFDNTGCTPGAVPDAEGQALIDFVRAREAQLGCNVDTTRSTLDIDQLDLRLSLEPPLVALSEYASGCLGWKGEPLALLAGPRDGAEMIGIAQPGDDITWEYEWMGEAPGWSFVTIYRDGTQAGLGWVWTEAVDQMLCTGLAG